MKDWMMLGACFLGAVIIFITAIGLVIGYFAVFAYGIGAAAGLVVRAFILIAWG